MQFPPLHRLRVCPPCADQSATGMKADRFDDAPVGYFQSHVVDGVCSICHEELDRPSTQCPERFNCKQVLFLEDCRHVFHMACIAQTAQRGRLECPDCRKPFADQDIKDMKEAYAEARLDWNVRTDVGDDDWDDDDGAGGGGDDVDDDDDFDIAAAVHDNDLVGLTGQLLNSERVRFLVNEVRDDDTEALLLSWAVQLGYIEMARLLLEFGAEINDRDISGNTALFYARSQPMARLLILNGANVDGENHRGETALYLAEQAGNDEVAAVLRAAGGTRGTRYS